MKRRYFTLIELLASMVIIMILVGLVLGGASMASRFAKENKCRAQITALEVIFEQYKTDWYFYPEANENEIQLTPSWWAQNLLDPDGKSYIDNTQLGLNEFVVGSDVGYVDPYGEPFYYHSVELSPLPATPLEIMNPEKFDLWSKGRDQGHGDAGVDDDGNATVDDAFDAKTMKAKNTDDITNWASN